jgi:hypothetical protein
MKMVLLALLAAASAASSARDAVLGEWRGTSTCVDRVKHPACTDEVVIYHFRAKGDDPATVTLEADKVVDGKVLRMGDLDCTYDAKLGAWLSEFRNERVHALWSFVVHGPDIEGTLVDLPDRNLVRRIAVQKQ